MTLPAKLRILRAQAGLTIMEAAKRAGISRDTLSDIEHGKRRPIMPTIKALAEAYNVPVEELLDEGKEIAGTVFSEKVLWDAIEEMREAREQMQSIYQYSQRGMHVSPDTMRMVNQEAREFYALLRKFLERQWAERAAGDREGAEQP